MLIEPLINEDVIRDKEMEFFEILIKSEIHPIQIKELDDPIDINYSDIIYSKLKEDSVVEVERIAKTLEANDALAFIILSDFIVRYVASIIAFKIEYSEFMENRSCVRLQ